LLRKSSFLIAPIALDAPVLSNSHGLTFFASDSSAVFYLSSLVPNPDHKVIPIYIHPDWHTHVPTPRSPLIVANWLEELQLHPNDDLVLSTLDNVNFGASYGYIGNRLEPVINPVDHKFYEHNLQPAFDKDIAKCFRTRIFDFHQLPPLPNCHRYPVKGVTKTFDCKVRLVNAQGAPYDGTDANSNIDIVNAVLFTFQVAMALLLICGPGTLMFKYDAAAAFKILNLHVQDYHLNGEAHPNGWAFSVKPNFGARSAGKLRDALGGLAEFIFRLVATSILTFQFLTRYSDDYLQFIPPCDDHLFTALSILAAVCTMAQRLGLPLGKFTFPSTRIIWLGLVLNSITMTAELTEERRLYLLHHIRIWIKRRHASRSDIESFHGHLQFVASIVKHGRFFLGSISALIHSQPGRNMLDIGKEAQADLHWWFRLLSTYEWSGISYLVRGVWTQCVDLSLEITTDACKKGRGAYYDGRWFSLPWTKKQLTQANRNLALSMVWLELHAIVDACATFGHLWRGLSITLQTDSMSVVEAWDQQRSHNPSLRYLFREICLLMSFHNFDLQIIHIPGKLNIKADLLSRLQVAKFLREFPSADTSSTTLCEWWLRT
jgi:hypothetical protein